MKFALGLTSAILTLTASIASAESRLGLGEWSASKPYQVTGVLSSDRILVLQEDVYFTCQLDDQGTFIDLSPCEPILTSGQRAYIAEQEVAAEKAYQDGLKADAQLAKELAGVSQVTSTSLKNAIISLAQENNCIYFVGDRQLTSALIRSKIYAKLGIDLSLLTNTQLITIRLLDESIILEMIWSGDIEYVDKNNQIRILKCG